MKLEFDSHTHTLASGHAYNTIMELAKGASEKGLKLLGITDHAPALPRTTHKDHFYNLKLVDRELYGVRLLMGAELNILDYEGTIDLPESILKTLDVLIASMHNLCMPVGGTVEQYTQAYLCAMDNPYVDIIGHPDDGDYLPDYEILVEASLAKHVLLEVNNTSLTPGGHRKNCRENLTRMLGVCMQKKAPIVIGSDAHFVSQVGGHQYAQALLDEVGFPRELILNTSTERFLDYLAENRRRRPD